MYRALFFLNIYSSKMYEVSICPETMLVHVCVCDVDNKENVSIPRSDKISRGSYAIFYNSINQRRKDMLLLCGTPVIIYASCHEQNEGPVGHYTSKPL